MGAVIGRDGTTGGGAGGRAVAPLPRGRHRLSREEVAASQRQRMLLALAEAMAEKGYVATTVKDVLTRAGVSRETFYQQFTSKLDCFVAAFDAAGEILVATIDAVDRPAGERADGDGRPDALATFERGLGAYLDALAVNLPFARLFLVEVYAAGPEAFERRAAVQQRFTEAIVALFEADDEATRFACEALVAAIATLVTGPIVRGDAAALRALHGPLVTLVRSALDRRAG